MSKIRHIPRYFNAVMSIQFSWAASLLIMCFSLSLFTHTHKYESHYSIERNYSQKQYTVEM